MFDPESSQLWRRRQIMVSLVLGSVCLSACGQQSVGRGPPTVDLLVESDGDLLEFRPKELTCPAGSHVRLRFHHTGKYVSFVHNWVLIRPGTFDAVTQAAILAGEEHGWLPVGHPAIIAATPTCGRGQIVTVEFDAPTPGRYLYICSTPGHSASMWGVLTIANT